MSPAMAAAAAIAGHLTDVRKLVGSAPASSSNQSTLQASQQAPASTEEQPEESPVDEYTDGEAQSAAAPAKSAPSSVAGVPKLTTIKGIAAPLDKSNVDTDAIIPKQYLKTIKRSGLGVGLFDAWRYNAQTHEEDPSFVLNQEPYRNAKILVVKGPNFGCGSSREHVSVVAALSVARLMSLIDFGEYRLLGHF